MHDKGNEVFSHLGGVGLKVGFVHGKFTALSQQYLKRSLDTSALTRLDDSQQFCLEESQVVVNVRLGFQISFSTDFC
jgi:hypothetical protein